MMPSSVDAPPAGAAYVPSPLKNVVVLFGHFGTKPCAVAEAFAVVMSVRESPASGSPVAFVNVPEEGVPSAPPETRFPLAVPVKAAVIVPAVKFPLASRATIALAVLREVAVVAAFGIPVRFVPVPEEGVPSAPPETRFPEAVPVNAPVKVVAPTVVKVAAPGVPPPIVPGAANVAPPSVAALTLVILVPTPAEGVPKSPPA